MPMWLVIPLGVAAAVALITLVWWSSGRAPLRQYHSPDPAEAERLRRAGLIETDDLPTRSGFPPP